MIDTITTRFMLRGSRDIEVRFRPPIDSARDQSVGDAGGFLLEQLRLCWQQAC
jgi:hypothetical protein